jgi:hypothetical protein
MESRSEQLEREAEETRWQLSGTLEELRGRLTPGRVIDQVIDHAREGPAAEFLRNLGREVRENPMPLVLIGIGIAWLMAVSNQSSRAFIAATADSAASKAADFGTATSAVVSRTGDWGQQTAARLADQASDLATAVGSKTVELTEQVRNITNALHGAGRSDRALDTGLTVAARGKVEIGKVRHVEDARAEATTREPR